MSDAPGSASTGDWRRGLYDRYVSAFKAADGVESESARRSRHRWCDHKYLPLLAGLDSAARIADIGCGAGGTLDYLRRRGFTRLSGVDISAEQVSLARERGFDVLEGSAVDFLAAAPDSWDLLIALDFIEHFERSELPRLVQAFHRALVPGGRLMLQTPNGSGLFPNQVVHGDLTHMTIFSPGSLAQLLRIGGFEDFVFAETGPAPTSLANRLRCVAWQAIRAAANGIRRIETGKRQDLWTENLICVCRRSAGAV